MEARVWEIWEGRSALSSAVSLETKGSLSAALMSFILYISGNPKDNPGRRKETKVEEKEAL